MAELRKNGGYDAMAVIYAQKMNAIFLARLVDNNPFTSTSTSRSRRPTSPASSCASRRSIATSSRRSAPPWCRPARRGLHRARARVVDGYGWPITGVFDLGWNEKTKYRVDPGFYTAEVSVLVNKAAWDRLTDAQKNVLRKAADVGEAEAAADFAAENQKETARQPPAASRRSSSTAPRPRLPRQGLSGRLEASSARAPRPAEAARVFLQGEVAKWSTRAPSSFHLSPLAGRGRHPRVSEDVG